MINWFNHLYPYSNLHELNLDWVIDTVKQGEKEIADFIGVNTIKYANPILWNIESQYEANTVVVDGQTGNAYISVKAVPSGVHINRTEYWTQIYNYANVVDTLREQIAHNEGDTNTATQPFAVGDLVFVKTLLYRVIAPMIAGDSFVENSNIVKTTIEDELKANIQAIQSEASARQSADTQLQSNIDAEASARQSADNTLQSNIDAEASARQSADATLQANIEAEAGARQSAITAEATARTNADNVISQRIDNISSELKYHKIVTIGDSYSLSTDGDGVLLPLGYISMIKNVTTHVNLSAGGSSFYNTSTYPTFLGQLQNAESGENITDGTNTIPKNEVTDIIVVGGYNDLPMVWGGTQSQLIGAIGQFMLYVNSNYTNAKVYVGMIGGTTIPVNYDGFSKIIEAYKSCCKYGGIYLNGVENVIAWEGALQNDGVHPNATGISLLEIAISSAFNYGYYQFDLAGLTAVVQLNLNTDLFSSGSINIQMKQYSNCVDVQINHNGLATSLSFSNNQTLTVVRSQFKIGTLSNLVGIGLSDGTTNLNIDVLVHDTTSDTFIYVPAQLTLIGNELYIELLTGTQYTINQIIICSSQTTLYVKPTIV